MLAERQERGTPDQARIEHQREELKQLPLMPRVKRALPDRGDVGPLEDAGGVENGVRAQDNDVRVQQPDVVELVARYDHALASGRATRCPGSAPARGSADAD